MKVMLVGGGSGGHVYPLIAVQKALADKDSNLDFVVVTDKIDELAGAQFIESTRFKKIYSGKIRRFAHWKWQDYFRPSHFQFYFLNIADTFKLMAGIFQSYKLLISEKPDVVFAKGGFVSVPVGIAAGWLKIPLVIHDSDSRPGIANKILAKRAAAIALGMKRENSNNYEVVGIPVREEFFMLDKITARKKLNLNPKKPLLLITGGSLGAMRVNNLVIENIKQLTKHFEIIHISGAGDFDRVNSLAKNYTNKTGYQLYPFVNNDYPALAVAADVAVGRAGATTIAEFAAASVASVFIPSSYLTDQVSNGRWLEKREAGLVLDEKQLEKNPKLFLEELLKLQSVEAQNKLSTKISKLAVKDSARKVAEIIYKTAKR